MKKILLYIWQLPQNLLGLLLIFIYNKKKVKVEGKRDKIKNLLKKIKYKGKKVYIYEKFPGGISLGNYILVDYYREMPETHARMRLSDSIKHEYGHTIQSKRWGPLYLPIPGLVSALHNQFCDCRRHSHQSYYNIWPENEADKLGGVIRK